MASNEVVSGRNGRTIDLGNSEASLRIAGGNGSILIRHDGIGTK